VHSFAAECKTPRDERQANPSLKKRRNRFPSPRPNPQRKSAAKCLSTQKTKESTRREQLSKCSPVDAFGLVFWGDRFIVDAPAGIQHPPVGVVV